MGKGGRGKAAAWPARQWHGYRVIPRGTVAKDIQDQEIARLFSVFRVLKAVAKDQDEAKLRHRREYRRLIEGSVAGTDWQPLAEECLSTTQIQAIEAPDTH